MRQITNKHSENELALASGVRLGSLLVLLFMVIYLAIVRLDLRAGPAGAAFQKSVLAWQQPEILDSIFPVKIAETNWQFDFSNIEKLVLQSKLIHNRAWRVSTDSLKLLERIVANLPTTMSDNDYNRLNFLLAKNLPEVNARRLFELIRKYNQYQVLYREQLKVFQQRIALNDLSALKTSAENLINLQQQVFGSEMAEQLFEERNLTTNYLNHRLFIRLDSSINEEAKNKKLIQLKSSYLQKLDEIKRVGG